ncbi:acyl homoserine lactone synthase [Rhodobacter sp. 24-YEA-8]|nr:acyl homoserine lactone synthase [Rhodobacter sp. 24-YEA-8]
MGVAMIIVIDAVNKHLFEDVLDDMYRLRARVFSDRLGWDVSIEQGREIDRFDHLDPLYLVGLDTEGEVISCVRLLQTTGPHMLSDVFSEILDGEAPLRSSRIWESTRFCVDTARLSRDGADTTVSRATCELMVATLETCRNAGISDIITVIDPVMNRVLKRSDNAPYDYVGTVKPMGKVSALAALLDCTDERIDRVRNFAALHENVVLSDAAALELRPVTAQHGLKNREVTVLPGQTGSAAFSPVIGLGHVPG